MKSKKLFLVLFSLVALLLNFSSARAADEAVFGPKDCEIGSWHLYFSRDLFHLDAPGNGVIVVKKETSGADFSGGFLFFNWRLIPLRDFLRGEEEIVYKDVTLRSKNRLTVFLRGSPGTSVSIEVRRLDSPVPLPEITFTAEPMALVPGESATLAWETAYADIVVLDHGIGDVPPAGTLSVTPEETTTYVLAAIGPGGSSTATVTVSIDPLPPSLEVGIVPESIYEGEAAVLTWAAENADSCAIEPDIGVVNPEGSVTVHPVETTTYTVVASGPGGMDTAEA